jgi:ABC-type cobalamin/Fe3+-siderophores transport system ATPase subunit
MDIIFNGKYKSITKFEWKNIPSFVVITGPNGTGKSQLLELINATFYPQHNINQRVAIIGRNFKSKEVTYLKGEWEMNNANTINLSSILAQRNSYFGGFKNRNVGYSPVAQTRIYDTFNEIQSKLGKPAA